MITPERVEMLRFMSEHKGITPSMFAAMGKAGTKMPEHASMIAVTPSEMRELLEAYKERDNGVQPE